VSDETEKPPPVDAGEAPMYMRMIVKNFEGSDSVAWFTVSNPAVRGVFFRCARVGRTPAGESDVPRV